MNLPEFNNNILFLTRHVCDLKTFFEIVLLILIQEMKKRKNVKSEKFQITYDLGKSRGLHENEIT